MWRTWMMGLGLGLVLWMGCSQDPGPGGAPSCGSDDDCKVDRICVAGECVDPATSAGHGGGTSSSTGRGGGTGGATDPSECLIDVKCANQLDCPQGYHCNTRLTMPRCQELYCGTEGTACSSDELCQIGHLCANGSCWKSPDCDNCCDAGQSCYEYASDVIGSYDSNPSCLDWESLPTWAALRDCICGLCASECRSWCRTEQYAQDSEACTTCMEVEAGIGSGAPDAACGKELAACVYLVGP
jgi:hypothetical protein